jgi:hypothetical protein
LYLQTADELIAAYEYLFRQAKWLLFSRLGYAGR